MRLLALVLTSSCAGWSPPQELVGDLKRVNLEIRDWNADSYDIELGGQPFQTTFETKRSRTWPRDVFHLDHRVAITTGKDWRIICDSKQRIEGGIRADRIFFTTQVTTSCSSEGMPPIMEVLMEGWPRVEGLLTINAIDYRIRATEEHRHRPAALVVYRAAEVALVVDATDRIWLRPGLPEPELRSLVRAAAVLLFSVELNSR